ncbi:transmembrane protein 154 isoform X1 [Poecilia formosa]|uniref:transmembrane protein 154 isoform X1 n=1 Tax=Poecilia formosa TaxID=48698 RepID=UPI000443E998|nr:PREDICTED: transmembrane protein 154 isoform X1 [Poecilia formosa]
MMGPRLKTPALFLLLLLGALTGTAFCDDGTTSETDSTSTSSEGTTTTTTVSSDPGDASTTNATAETEGSGSDEPDTSTNKFPMTEKSESYIDNDPSILIGAVVAGIIVCAIIVAGVVIWWRSSKKAGNQELAKEDPHLDGPSSEKVPMPKFEEDVPSVLELEMDELDQWMKKDS